MRYPPISTNRMTWKARLEFTVLTFLEFSAGTQWYRERWLLDKGPFTFIFYPAPQKASNAHM